MLKPACRYKTRLGRRIALIAYTPLIPLLAVLLMIEVVVKELPDTFRAFAEVWRQ
jgi:hypothetical protein